MTAEPDPEAVRFAEAALDAIGIHGARVRVHGDVARVDVPPQERERFAAPDLREAAVAAVRAAGFRFVALDLDRSHGR